MAAPPEGYLELLSGLPALPPDSKDKTMWEAEVADIFSVLFAGEDMQIVMEPPQGMPQAEPVQQQQQQVQLQSAFNFGLVTTGVVGGNGALQNPLAGTAPGWPAEAPPIASAGTLGFIPGQMKATTDEYNQRAAVELHRSLTASSGGSGGSAGPSGGTQPRRVGAKPKPNTKPYRDKNRDNKIAISKLELEIQEKLTLVKELQERNEELKRKERLLQMSVVTTEQNISLLGDSKLDAHLQHLLQCFRSSINQAAAKSVVARLSNIKEGTDLTPALFRACWQTMVLEMGDALVAESTASTPEEKAAAAVQLKRLTDSVIDYTMALCTQPFNRIIKTALSTSMQTGEEWEVPAAYWEAVIQKVELGQEQVKDLLGALELFVRCFSAVTAECAQLKAALAAATERQQRHLERGLLWGRPEDVCDVAQVANKLESNIIRCNTLHILLSFLALRCFTPSQIAKLCVHGMPAFPNPKHLLMAVLTRQQSQGLPLPPGLGALAASSNGIGAAKPGAWQGGPEAGAGSKGQGQGLGLPGASASLRAGLGGPMGPLGAAGAGLSGAAGLTAFSAGQGQAGLGQAYGSGPMPMLPGVHGATGAGVPTAASLLALIESPPGLQLRTRTSLC